MSGKIKRNPRTRSSKQFCQEKFSCDGERIVAKYVCEECGTLQCEDCEVKLHELTKFVFHDRKPLLEPPAEKLCQLSCEEKNFADVRCTNCELNFCHACYDKMHNHGRRRQHEKVTMKEASKRQTQNDSKTAAMSIPTEQAEKAEVKLKEPPSANGIEPIKPNSPLSDDDSLTYVTMPQTQNHFEDDSSIAILDTTSSCDSHSNMPDVIDLEIRDIYTNSDATFGSNRTKPQSTAEIDEEIYSSCKSFLLADQHEYIQVYHSATQASTHWLNTDNCQKLLNTLENFLISPQKPLPML